MTKFARQTVRMSPTAFHYGAGIALAMDAEYPARGPTVPLLQALRTEMSSLTRQAQAAGASQNEIDRIITGTGLLEQRIAAMRNLLRKHLD